MQTTHFWHQLNLRSKKVNTLLLTTILALFLSVSNDCLAQKKNKLASILHLKNSHFGFTVGLHQFNTVLESHDSITVVDGSTTFPVKVANQFGYTVGFIYNYSLPDPYWNLRILPNFTLYSRDIKADTITGLKPDEVINTYFLEVPLQVLYRSKQRSGSSMYMMGGFTPSIQVGNSLEDAELKKYPQFSQFNLTADIAVGWMTFQKYIHLSPELRFSFGLFDIYEKNGSDWDKYIKSAHTYKISLLLNFEG